MRALDLEGEHLGVKPPEEALPVRCRGGDREPVGAGALVDRRVQGDEELALSAGEPGVELVDHDGARVEPVLDEPVGGDGS